MAKASCKNALIDSLRDPSRYPHPVKTVRILETHISWVLLAGKFAYKIKKPVNLGFLDFTELDKRQFYCDEEIRLNHRLAPQLYLDVVTIGGNLPRPIFGAEPILEYAVRMRRFPTAKLLDRLVSRNRLMPQHIDQLAVALAGFHAKLQPAALDTNYGTCMAIAAPARQNFLQLATILKAEDTETLATLQTVSEQEFTNCLDLFEQRRQAGFIRECHGDLHLGNIVLIKNTPVAFDCIEFDPKLRWIDIINEIAFLIMDLHYRGRADLAFRFLNSYLEIIGDYHGLGVLRFYLGYRAMVRAKITAMRASQTSAESGLSECRDYLSLAARCLTKRLPALIITYGLPGCGKTTISQIVLEKLQIIRLRSDVERKRLFGMAAHESSGGGIYDVQATQRTYARLLQRARELLELSFPVIIDAAFLKSAQRQQFRALAEEMQVPFIILSIQTDTTLLHQRIRLRQKLGNDASEADISVLKNLEIVCEPLQPGELGVTVEFVNNTTVMDASADHEVWNKLDRLLINSKLQ